MPSPRLKARITGFLYLLTFVSGFLGLLAGRNMAFVGNLVGDFIYLAVTVLLYDLFKPAGRGLSLIAMLISLAGCVLGILRLTHLAPAGISTLVFFGFYCVLLGYLIHRSTFLPHGLGWLMVFAGLGWLTYLSPTLGSRLAPFNMLPGVLGEGALMLWLLVRGVNEPRWMEQAGAVEIAPAGAALS